MAEELKHLLEKIQKDGVEKAKAQAEEIVSDAEKKAAQIVKEAEAKAEEIKQQAEKNAERFHEKAVSALSQSARDILIAVGQGLERVLDGVIMREVGDGMSTETVKNILMKMTETYLSDPEKAQSIELALTEEDHNALKDFFTEKMKQQLDKGMKVTVNERLGRGFTVSLRDQNMYHDFSQKAIAEELGVRLRPEIQKIVQEVAKSQEGK